MNQQQLLDFLKSTIVLIGSAATTHGIGTASWWESAAGFAVTVAPFVWGWLRNTYLAQVQRTAGLENVVKVLLKPSVGNGLAAAAADPKQPKIDIAPPGPFPGSLRP